MKRKAKSPIDLPDELSDLEDSIADEQEEDDDIDIGSEADDASDEESIDEAEEDEGSSDDGNEKLVSTISKILKQSKPKTKKTIVLSKAKKLQQKEEEKKNRLGFQIDGEIKQEEEIKPDKEILDKVLERKAKKNAILALRVKPTFADRDRERGFKKIATRGVVQLFNAVRAQQKDLIEKLEEAGPLDHKRDAVLNNINKKQFLDVLMSGDRAKSEAVDNPVKKEEVVGADGEQRSEWKVFRDDFMLGCNKANWDKDEDGEEDSGGIQSDDSVDV